MRKLDVLAAVLVVVGGLNWGLVALAEFDLVAALFGLEFGETECRYATCLRPRRPGRRLPDRTAGGSAAAGHQPPS